MFFKKYIPEYPDFEIKSHKSVSQEFLKRNISTFKSAASFVQNLPYGRNADKSDLTTLFAENCGTCSTKHALLKQLADENNFEGLQLIVGLFKMNSKNTPEISHTLKNNSLDYIPEAHCYLKFNNNIFDFTKLNSKPGNFSNDLMEEKEISISQIADYKINYHKNYLTSWLSNNRQINLSLNDLWEIREQCIQDLTLN